MPVAHSVRLWQLTNKNTEKGQKKCEQNILNIVRTLKCPWKNGCVASRSHVISLKFASIYSFSRDLITSSVFLKVLSILITVNNNKKKQINLCYK